MTFRSQTVTPRRGVAQINDACTLRRYLRDSKVNDNLQKSKIIQKSQNHKHNQKKPQFVADHPKKPNLSSQTLHLNEPHSTLSTKNGE